MSQENVELAYRAFDAFARHDLDVFVAFHEPDCEIQSWTLESFSPTGMG